MFNDINWDEIKEKLAEAVKLDKDDDKMTITMTVLKADDLKEDKMFGKMMNLDKKEEMKQQYGQYMGLDGPLDCEIEFSEESEDQKAVTFTMKDEEQFKKLYDLLNDMFFGDFFQKMLEAMMGAFKGMFGGGGEDQGGPSFGP